MLYVMLFFVVVIFFFSGMVALFTFNDLLYFTEGKNGPSILNECVYMYIIILHMFPCISVPCFAREECLYIPDGL